MLPLVAWSMGLGPMDEVLFFFEPNFRFLVVATQIFFGNFSPRSLGETMIQFDEHIFSHGLKTTK